MKRSWPHTIGTFLSVVAICVGLANFAQALDADFGSRPDASVSANDSMPISIATESQHSCPIHSNTGSTSHCGFGHCSGLVAGQGPFEFSVVAAEYFITADGAPLSPQIEGPKRPPKS